MKLVHGVGVYEKGNYVASIDRINTKEYALWIGMLQRCYSSKCQLRHPSYIGCSVSENFKNFQFFARWCHNQVMFGVEGYQLDKDIVFKGNKQYSESTCFFIPARLNAFLPKSVTSRGEFPIGVSFNKSMNKFSSRVNEGSIRKSLGHYNTPEEAFLVYKTYKEALAKQLAKEYEGLVHPKVIEALNNYVVEITD